jgi:flagellar biosynthesis/type III secretory pathway M-ring protein FliF/YscJ
VQLAGLPVPTKAAPQQQDTFNTGLLWLVALLIVLMILCGIGGYVYTTRKRQAANARQKQIARKGATTAASKKAAASVTKESLLQELLELDKAYEAGKLKKAAYQEQRARLRNRLRPFMNEQPEKRGEAAKQTANGSGKGEK